MSIKISVPKFYFDNYYEQINDFLKSLSYLGLKDFILKEGLHRERVYFQKGFINLCVENKTMKLELEYFINELVNSKYLKITDKRACLHGSLRSIHLNKENYGFRCTEKAVENILKNPSGTSVYSIIYRYEPIWVSVEEFFELNALEFEFDKRFVANNRGKHRDLTYIEE